MNVVRVSRGNDKSTPFKLCSHAPLTMTCSDWDADGRAVFRFLGDACAGATRPTVFSTGKLWRDLVGAFFAGVFFEFVVNNPTLQHSGLVAHDQCGDILLAPLFG